MTLGCEFYEFRPFLFFGLDTELGKLLAKGFPGNRNNIATIHDLEQIKKYGSMRTVADIIGGKKFTPPQRSPLSIQKVENHLHTKTNGQRQDCAFSGSHSNWNLDRNDFLRIHLKHILSPDRKTPPKCRQRWIR